MQQLLKRPMDRQSVNGRSIFSASSGRCMALGASVLLALLSTGCEVDSFMDPTVIGRWEQTPTAVPILDRIASLEGDADDVILTSEVSADDLIPEIIAYRISQGDELELITFDLPSLGTATPYRRTVGPQGTIELPQLGPIVVSGLTVEEAQQAISNTIVQKGLMQSNPLISVEAVGQREQLFHVMGAVRGPGAYQIPEPNYRLLEALTAAGGFDETIEEVLVIRQVPLTDSAAGIPVSLPFTPSQSEPAQSGEDLIDLIDELAGPEAENADPSPSMMGRNRTDVYRPVINLTNSDDDRQPAIDLVEAPPQTPSSVVEGAGFEESLDQPTSWVFLNGQWVPISQGSSGERSVSATGEISAGSRKLFTQRIISVPVRPLIAGDPKYNIVIRPSDLIRVPQPPTGNIYLAGQVARPGVYSLAQGLTLMRAVDAAGGLSAIGIPERVDLTRELYHGRQATIRLDLRAINEQTQPDIYLKPNDRINIGTNVWALPLAVIRNGFRMSYGFGFLLDRNFGADVFGPPPSSIFR